MYLGTLNKQLAICKVDSQGDVIGGQSGCYNLIPVFDWIRRCITSIFLVFFIAFLIVEIYVAPEPVMAPALLRQKVPVLVSASNFLVAACNFSVTYFFPMWFQVVTLESASTAGACLFLSCCSSRS